MAALLIVKPDLAIFGSEYGVSTYRPGLVDLFAGYLGPPETNLIKSYFYVPGRERVGGYPEQTDRSRFPHNYIYIGLSLIHI